MCVKITSQPRKAPARRQVVVFNRGRVSSESFGNAVIHRTVADVGTGAQLVAAGGMTFGGNGKVLSWDIYAGRPGTVSLQVWRPEPGLPNVYRVVCENTVTALASGLASFEVTPAEQCAFVAGDAVGWSHRDAGVIEYDEAPGNNAADQVLWRWAPPSFLRIVALSEDDRHTSDV